MSPTCDQHSLCIKFTHIARVIVAIDRQLQQQEERMDYKLKTETKINVYRKIYNEVKNDPDVMDVGYPDEKEDLDFYGKIGDFLFDFSIKTKVDMLKVKASGDFNLSEDQLLDYGNSITENETGIMFTTYDQKVIFQLSLPLTGMEDTAAESMMVESTRRFIVFMKKASDKMNELKKENPVLQNKNESKTELSAEQLTEAAKENEAVTQNTDQFSEQELNVPEDENIEPEKKAELSDDTTERANTTDPDTEPVGVDLDAEDLPSSDLSSDTQASEKDMELESISNDFSYEQAPEVKQQMADMYDALERSFDKKKKQILFREELVKKQKAILESEKVQLREKKDEFAKELERLTSEKEKLENEWVTYNNADTELRNKQQAMKTQEKQYRESEKFFKQKEQSFKDKNENLEKRIASVNARTNAMKDKEKKLEAFEQSLKRQQQDIQRKLSDISDKEAILQIREKDLHLKEEQINIEKDAITEKTADLKELEEYVSGLEKAAMPVDVDAYESEIQQLKAELSNEKNRVVDLSDTSQSLTIDLSEKNKLLESMQEQVEHLKNEANATRNQLAENTDAYQKKMDEQKNSYEKALEERNARIRELDERVATYEQKEEAELTADKVLAELESLGIDAKHMPSENEGLISCEVSGCKIVFNVPVGMLCVSKAVRKKYAKDLVTWNGEDITASYFQDKTSIYCKKRFFKTGDYQKAVEKFQNLK